MVSRLVFLACSFALGTSGQEVPLKHLKNIPAQQTVENPRPTAALSALALKASWKGIPLEKRDTAVRAFVSKYGFHSPTPEPNLESIKVLWKIIDAPDAHKQANRATSFMAIYALEEILGRLGRHPESPHGAFVRAVNVARLKAIEESWTFSRRVLEMTQDHPLISDYTADQRYYNPISASLLAIGQKTRGLPPNSDDLGSVWLDLDLVRAGQFHVAVEILQKLERSRVAGYRADSIGMNLMKVLLESLEDPNLKVSECIEILRALSLGSSQAFSKYQSGHYNTTIWAIFLGHPSYSIQYAILKMLGDEGFHGKEDSIVAEARRAGAKDVRDLFLQFRGVTIIRSSSFFHPKRIGFKRYLEILGWLRDLPDDELAKLTGSPSLNPFFRIFEKGPDDDVLRSHLSESDAEELETFTIEHAQLRSRKGLAGERELQDLLFSTKNVPARNQIFRQLDPNFPENPHPHDVKMALRRFVYEQDIIPGVGLYIWQGFDLFEPEELAELLNSRGSQYILLGILNEFQPTVTEAMRPWFEKVCATIRTFRNLFKRKERSDLELQLFDANLIDKFTAMEMPLWAEQLFLSIFEFDRVEQIYERAFEIIETDPRRWHGFAGSLVQDAWVRGGDLKTVTRKKMQRHPEVFLYAVHLFLREGKQGSSLPDFGEDAVEVTSRILKRWVRKNPKFFTKEVSQAVRDSLLYLTKISSSAVDLKTQVPDVRLRDLAYEALARVFHVSRQRKDLEVEDVVFTLLSQQHKQAQIVMAPVDLVKFLRQVSESTTPQRFREFIAKHQRYLAFELTNRGWLPLFIDGDVLPQNEKQVVKAVVQFLLEESSLDAEIKEHLKVSMKSARVCYYYLPPSRVY